MQALAELLPCTRLAVDCEGVQLSREGRLCLVQIGGNSAVYILDVISLLEQATGKSALVLILKTLFGDSNRVKVLHDCRHDAEALHFQV